MVGLWAVIAVGTETYILMRAQGKQEMKPICIGTEITEPWYFIHI
jgi:hypothetical protein